jgi:hypothetical protein
MANRIIEQVKYKLLPNRRVRMKNVFFVVMLGMVLALGMLVVGCENGAGCSSDGGCYYGTSISQPYKWCGEGGCSVLTKDNSRCDC